MGGGGCTALTQCDACCNGDRPSSLTLRYVPGAGFVNSQGDRAGSSGTSCHTVAVGILPSPVVPRAGRPAQKAVLTKCAFIVTSAALSTQMPTTPSLPSLGIHAPRRAAVKRSSVFGVSHGSNRLPLPGTLPTSGTTFTFPDYGVSVFLNPGESVTLTPGRFEANTDVTFAGGSIFFHTSCSRVRSLPVTLQFVTNARTQLFPPLRL